MRLVACEAGRRAVLAGGVGPCVHLRPHGSRQRVRRTHPWVEAETDKGEADLGGGMREAHLDT